VVDENPAHLASCDREEVRSVLPGDVHFHELHERFVDDCRGLKRMSGALPAHVAAGTVTEFFVDQRREPFQGAYVARAPGGQQARDRLAVRRLNGCCDRVAQDGAPRANALNFIE
jgi:hypothetical protein